MDQKTRLAYINVWCSIVYKWWEICHTPSTRINNMDITNKICTTPRSWIIWMSGERIFYVFLAFFPFCCCCFYSTYPCIPMQILVHTHIFSIIYHSIHPFLCSRSNFSPLLLHIWIVCSCSFTFFITIIRIIINIIHIVKECEWMRKWKEAGTLHTETHLILDSFDSIFIFSISRKWLFIFPYIWQLNRAE